MLGFNVKSWIMCAGTCANAGRCHRIHLCHGCYDPEQEDFEQLYGKGHSKFPHRRWAGTKVVPLSR